MTRIWVNFALGLLLVVPSGCGEKGKTPARQPAAAPTAPKSPGTQTQEKKANKPSKGSVIELAREQLKTPLRSPKAIGAAIQAANALAKWAKENGDLAPEALYLSVRFRLFATAASAGLRTGPAARALGGDGAQGRQLRKAVTTLKALAKSKETKFPDFGRTTLAVRAALGINPDVKDVQFSIRRALDLARGTTPEGLALRAVWLDRLEMALQTLRAPDPDYRFFRFSRKVGRMLCPACSDSHHVTPNMVTATLLMQKNKGGFICDGAYAAEAQGKSPTAQIEALSRCTDTFGFAPGMEQTMYWGANLLATGVLRIAHQLVSADVEESPATSAVTKRTKAVKKLLTAPLALPIPLVTRILPAHGKRSDLEHVGVMNGLGFAGQTSQRHRLELYIVSPSQFRVGFRPLVRLENGRLTSVSNAAGYPAGGQEVISVDALASAPRKADGSVQVVTTAAGRILETLKTLKGVQPVPAPDAKDGAIADVVVDALAGSSVVVRVIDSLKAAGYRHFRFVKTAAIGQALPLVVREAPAELVTSLKVGYAQPLTAVVTRTHVDVWAPSQPTGKVTPLKPKTSVPEDAIPGYRGRQLVRYRIPIPEGIGQGLDSQTMESVKRAIVVLRERSGAGSLLHVIGTADALAADVLRVSRVFQEARGTRLEKPETIWPETQCGGEGNVVNRRRPKGCPTGVAVAFSKAPRPSDKGVVSRLPKKAKKAKAKPGASAPAASEAPRPGFCDKRELRAAMKRRSAGFRFCYERELRLDKSLEGRVTLKFTIGPNGGLTGTPQIASSTLKNRGVHECLIRNVQRVTFPKPVGGSCQIRWPLKFAPKN